jgi:hypothetical protein
MHVLTCIQQAVALKKSHQAALNVEALDAVLGEARLSCKDVTEFGRGEQLTPAERAFVSSAFTRGIYEDEFLAWQQAPADPVLQDYVRKVWREEVLPAFLDRYTSSGPLPPVFPAERSAQRLLRLL